MAQEIEHIQLETLFVEQQVLMLRVYINQHLAQFFHQSKLGGRVIDKSAALARNIQLAAQDALIVILQLVVIEERLHAIRSNIKFGLDDTFLRTRTNRFHIGPLT